MYTSVQPKRARHPGILALFALVPVLGLGADPTVFTLDADETGAIRSIELDGTWLFQPAAFVPFGQSLEEGVPISVPAGWHLEPQIDAGRFGYGTYLTTLAIPEGTLGPGDTIAFWVRQISSSATVFWNGSVVYSSGIPGISRSEERSSWKPAVVILPDPQPINELRVWVSNHRDVAPGITSPLTVGPAEALFAQQRSLLAGAIFIAGVLAIMGLYHFVLFILRPRDRATRAFAFFLIAVAIRVLVVDHLPLVQIMGEVPYGMLMRLSYVTYPIPVILILAFLESLFPDDTWKPALRGIQIGALAMTAVVLTLPVHVFIAGTRFFHPLAAGAGGVVVATMVNALRRRRPTAGLFSAGIVVLTVAALHDILRALSILATPMLVPVATLAFVLIEAVVLARQHVLALQEAEATSRSLSAVNAAVQRFVPQEMLRLMGVADVTTAELGHVTQLEMPVLFLDIRGFTKISEHLGPERSYRFVNDFLGIMGPIIREEGGVVDKYLGDGLFALFPGGTDAAVRAGMRLRSAQQRLRERVGPDLPDDLEYGIGIHTGPLMLGTIGERQRMETSAISDTVNLASRIESLTKVFGVGLAISASSYMAVSEELRAESRFLGKVPIRGKSDGVAVFDVFGGEAESIQDLRQTTATSFERGVVSYFLEDYQDAESAFQDVLSSNPGDVASIRYLSLCEQKVPPLLGITAAAL